MAKTRRRYYKEVSANTEDVDEFTVPSGTYFISQVGGDASTSPDTKVCIIWDYGGADEILLVTHGDAMQDVQIEVVGNGTKTLAICLTNDQGTDDVMGGFWIGST